MYKDEIEKIKFYRDDLIKKYREQGQIIDQDKLQQKIDELDIKIAIFSQRYIQSGSTFNVDKFNSQKQDIYTDLAILYKVIFDLAQNKITDIQAYIKVSLASLEEKATRFKYLVDSESVSIYGKTVYNAANNFKQLYNNGQNTISLGSINIPSGSYLACIFSSDEVEQANIKFVFDEKNIVSAYGYNQDKLKILGNYKINKDKQTIKNISFNKDNINTSFILTANNQYNLYVNSNKIITKKIDSGVSTTIDYKTGISYETTDYEEISFYVYGASYIELNENRIPEYRNVVQTSIKDPNRSQKIIIRAKQGYALNIITDGEIYAIKDKAYFKNNQLAITSNIDNVTDYMLEEIYIGEDVVFNDVKVIVSNADKTIYDINYIIIKAAQAEDIS